MHEFEILNCGAAAVEDIITISVQSQKRDNGVLQKYWTTKETIYHALNSTKFQKQKGDSSSIFCENQMITEKVE